MPSQPTYRDLFQRIVGAISEHAADKLPLHRAAFVVDQASLIRVELSLDGPTAQLLAEAAANAFRNSFSVDGLSIAVEAVARAIQISISEGS